MNRAKQTATRAQADGNGWRGTLGYCTNVHPGESLEAMQGVLAREVSAVRTIDEPHARRWPVGLRIAGPAATQIESEGLEGCRRLAAFVAHRGLRVFTINGFPHGSFHGQAVKAGVYRPDWSEAERGRYTRQLVPIFAEMLPLGGRGSISTVPLGHRSRIDGAARERAVDQLHRVLELLVDTERETGRRIELALEPEPDCALATVGEFGDFFTRDLLADAALATLSSRNGWTKGECAALVQRHIGLCLDACHAAVQFESSDAVLTAVRACGARISKLQISAALAIDGADPEAIAQLASFDDPVYLHQVTIRGPDGQLEHFPDLPPALARGVRFPGREDWRVHFHVPIHTRSLGRLSTTSDELRDLIERLGQHQLGQHQLGRADTRIHDFEVETYTWGVLPDEYKSRTLASSIAAELQWARAACESAGLLVPRAGSPANEVQIPS